MFGNTISSGEGKMKMEVDELWRLVGQDCPSCNGQLYLIKYWQGGKECWCTTCTWDDGPPRSVSVDEAEELKRRPVASSVIKKGPLATATLLSPAVSEEYGRVVSAFQRKMRKSA
ncbi:MAG: hypothetical protein WCT40_02435 [Candidatus Magasanikbacteria bacterium]|jgi:hypothetical protein